jgi:integrase
VLGYHTGMRSGELLEIQEADVDLVAGIITLRRETTKNSEPKTVPIYGDMAGEIAEALKSNDPRCPYLVQRWTEGGRVFRNCTPGGHVRVWSIKLKSPATVKMLRRADLPEAWVLRRVLPIKAKTEAAAKGILSALGLARTAEPVDSFRKVWASACRAVGVPGLKFHDLRRTAAVRMIEAGLDERLAMEIGGWKTRAMLDRYAIRTPERMKKAGEKLEAHMAAVTAPVKQAGRVS